MSPFTGNAAALTLDPAEDDKPPFFLPNRAAYRAASKPVKTRLRKATKWAHRVESTAPDSPLVGLFRHLAAGAADDLVTLKEARA